MPRPISSVRVPLGLAQEIEWLLRCAEAIPVIGGDATEARQALCALQPSIFAAPRDQGPACAVCGNPVPIERVVNAAMRGQTALYDTDRCRETARKRRYRSE